MERTVEAAQNMIRDLHLTGMTGLRIAESSGVNYSTVSDIRNGRSARVSAGVFDKIKAVWSERPVEAVKPETVPPAPKRIRSKASPVAVAATSDAPFDAAGMINRTYVPVNIGAIVGVFDKILQGFETQQKELEELRGALNPAKDPKRIETL